MNQYLDESPFAAIAKTLKKYGGKDDVKDDSGKSPKRSIVHTDVAMTGHKEKFNKNGSRSYTKILPDDDSSDGKKAAAVAKDVAKQTAEPAEKRKAGRPAGKHGGTYKARDPESKAASAAKAAASKAANKAKRAELTKEDLDEMIGDFDINEMVEFMLDEEFMEMDEDSQDFVNDYISGRLDELSMGTLQSYRKKKLSGVGNEPRSDKDQEGITRAYQKVSKKGHEERTANDDKSASAAKGYGKGRYMSDSVDTDDEESMDESFAVYDPAGKQVAVEFSEGSAKKKAEDLTKRTGKKHTVKFDRAAMVSAKNESTMSLYESTLSSSSIFSKLAR